MLIGSLVKATVELQGFRVIHVAGNVDGLVVTLGPDRRYAPRCGRCHEPAPSRDTRRIRHFRHVPIWGVAVALRYAPRRVSCSRCAGVRIESMPWVSGKQRMTRALVVTLATWARVLAWEQVARLFHCAWGTVATAVDEAVAYGLAHRDLEGVTHIGIDEISRKRGHVYVTNVYDLQDKRLLWSGEGRSKATLEAFFEFLGPEKTAAIEGICCDMWQPYIEVVKDRAPQAVLVFDKFHIVRHLMEALDQVRRDEIREKGPQHKALMHKTRFIWLKNPSNLTERQAHRLGETNAMDGTSHFRTAHGHSTENTRYLPLRHVERAQTRRRTAGRTSPRLRGIATILGAAALLPVLAAPAHAAELVLVSNVDQEVHPSDFFETIGPTWRAQKFRTGSNAGRYDLTSIDLNLHRAPADGSSLTVKVTEVTLSGDPGSDRYVLTNPGTVGTGIQKFTAPDDAYLEGGTNYFVLAIYNGPHGSGSPQWATTNQDTEDSGAVEGWRIANGDRYSEDSGNNWSGSSHAHKIRVNGLNHPPTSSDKTVSMVEDQNIVYTFAAADFGFEDDNDWHTLNHVKVTSLPGSGEGGLRLDGQRVASGDEVTPTQLADGGLRYVLPANANGSPLTTFNFKVNDGFDDSASEYTVAIDVTAVNDAPTASDNTVFVVEAENPVYTFSVADFGFQDYADPDDTLAHVKILWLPGGDGSLGGGDKGTLSLDGTEGAPPRVIRNYELPKQVTSTEIGEGKLKYTPPADANGHPFTRFNFKVSDGTDDSESEYTMTIDVTAVNDPPVARDNDVRGRANTDVIIHVLSNDSDVNGDTLRVSGVGTPSNGTATITDSGTTITYEPNNDFVGTDTFTYTVSDGQDPALTDTGLVTMTLVPRVSGPRTVSDYAENGTEAVAIYAATGTPTWRLSGDDSGDFSISTDGVLSFSSSPDYEAPADADEGNDYEVTVEATVDVDGVSFTGTRDVTVTVTGVNEDGVWSERQEFSFPENATGAAAAITFTDPENELHDASSVSGDDENLFDTVFSHYTNNKGKKINTVRSWFAEPTSHGSWMTHISPDFESPTDSDGDNVYELTYVVSIGGASFTRSIAINVTDVNEVPVAGDDTPTTDEDTAVVIGVLDNDSDQDANTTLSVTAVGTSDGVDTLTETNPANGTAAIAGNGTTVTYTPDDNFNGTDTFTYTVSDGELTDTGTVTVTVHAVNDAPVAGDDTLTIDEDASATDIDVITGNDTDVDGDTLSVTAVGTGENGPVNGTAAIKAGSITTVTYTPNADFAGIDTFTYTVSDGELTGTGTVTVNVTPTVSGPTGPSYAENDTGPVGTYLAGGTPDWTLSGTDSDNFSIDDSGVLRFKEPPDYEFPTDAGKDNEYEMTVEASVGGVTRKLDVTVTVTNVANGSIWDNDPPVARDDEATTAEATALDISIADLLANDSVDEGSPLSVSEVGAPANGTAAITGGGTTVTYTPDDNFVGTDTFTYTISDGTRTDTGTVTVSVVPRVSDGPTEPSYAENGTAAVGTYTAGGNPTWSLSGTDSGQFSIDAGGVLKFGSSPNFESPTDDDGGNDYVVTVEASAAGVTGTLDVTVTVTGVNEAPVAVDDTVTTAEDRAVVIGVLDNDTDQDAGTTLSVTRVGPFDGVDTSTEFNPANGTAEITEGSTTTVTYTPNAHFNGTDTFTYIVSDGANPALTAIGTVTVTVNAVNDVPTGADKTVSTNEHTPYTFDADDFGFADAADDSTLAHVKITSLPENPDGVVQGTLSLDSTAIAIASDTHFVVMKADLDGDKLTYIPPANGAVSATFNFKVNDGTADSDDEYTITIDVANVEDNATLSGLTISSGPVDFDADTRKYTVHVGNPVTRVTVIPTALDNRATVAVKVNGTQVSGAVDLTEGATTTIVITVTSENGLVTEVYEMAVARALSANATLSGLTISSGTLDFDPGTSSYTVEVGNDVTSVTVTPTADDDGATVRVNDETVDSGNASGDIVLTEGAITTITVVVTAQDGATVSTYIIAAVPPWPWLTGSVLPPLTLYAGGEEKRVDAGTAIGGNDLSWTFGSSDSGVASVQGDGSEVIITPGREGKAEVTATAENNEGSTSVTFAVSVRTSVVEAAAIRATLTGHGRVLLGSVSEVIGERVGGGPEGASSVAGGGCGGTADGDGGGFHAGGRAWNADHGSVSGRYDSGFGGSLGDRFRGGDAGLDGVPHAGHGERGVGMEGDVEDALPLIWGRSFSFALGGRAADCDGAVGSADRGWHLWGAADLQRASGEMDTSDFDGEWRFLYLGVDRAFNERWMGGLSVSHVWGEADYSFDDDSLSGAGRLSSTMIGIYPYLQGELSSGLRLWAIGGLGYGDAENVREHLDGRRDEGDLDMLLGATGLSKALSPVGDTDLSLIGDAGFVSLSTDGEGSLDGAQTSVSRVRLGVEAARRFAVGLEPFGRLYGRYDGGDGPAGGAAEMVLGLRYAGERLDLEVRGNYLASSADFEQWGANAQVGYGPSSDGDGLTGSLTTQWGAAESGGSFLHGHTMQMPGAGFDSARGERSSPELSGEIAYRLSIHSVRGSLIPNLGYHYSRPGTVRRRFGLAYELSRDLVRDFGLRLELARTEREETAPDHAIELNAELRF